MPFSLRMQLCFEKQLAMLEQGDLLLEQESYLSKMEAELEAREADVAQRKEKLTQYEQEVCITTVFDIGMYREKVMQLKNILLL